MKLTETKVKNAKTNEGRQIKLADGGGLYLLVTFDREAVALEVSLQREREVDVIWALSWSDISSGSRLAP